MCSETKADWTSQEWHAGHTGWSTTWRKWGWCAQNFARFLNLRSWLTFGARQRHSQECSAVRLEGDDAGEQLGTGR